MYQSQILPPAFISNQERSHVTLSITEYPEAFYIEASPSLLETTQDLHNQTSCIVQQCVPMLSPPMKEFNGLVENDVRNFKGECFSSKHQGNTQSFEKSMVNEFYAKYCCCLDPQSAQPISEEERIKRMTPSEIKLVRKMQREFPRILEQTHRFLAESLSHLPSDEEIAINKRAKTRKTHIGDDFRGSKYIGVSKNGGAWQVYIIINKSKKYVGCYKSKLQAAAIYDKLAINFHGKKAKTNFSYTKREVLQIIGAI
ncbi:unnamed protein product [Moneuplotes crassus]|uniref:AP2/ERF domain-containing protein n=1 Tax=Euplotes crassus TaxID=5936 RepID=A0AAD1Y3J7_EUPCR|nr:unnamed protein product [Moneuplotes crassus]